MTAPRGEVLRGVRDAPGAGVFAVWLRFLPHEVAEYVTARAIREGKNVAGLVAEILGAESRRR